MPSPKAVLLDVGGIFFLPDHDRIRGAFARAGATAFRDDLDRAHYHGAAQLTVETLDEIEWPKYWGRYMDAFVTACKIPDELRADVRGHLDSEFADAALWLRIAPGCVHGLRALEATGVRLGVVSNADGLIGSRLREYEVLQVGPGVGVEVECVIDSGEVGVSKPDPRIFRLALDAVGAEPQDAWYVGDMPGFDVAGARAAGIRPFVMDPYRLHLNADYDRVGSLAELAELVEG
ncbi:MAG: HAD family hydrolase [Actinomycetota bacterium]